MRLKISKKRCLDVLVNSGSRNEDTKSKEMRDGKVRLVEHVNEQNGRYWGVPAAVPCPGERIGKKGCDLYDTVLALHK